MYVFTVYASCVSPWLLNQYVWITVSIGMARALGWSVIHVQWRVKSVRRKAKRTYYIERVRQCEHIFELHRMRGYGCFSRQPCTLFALMGAAALSGTHHAQCGLHSIVVAFTLCLIFCFRTSSFFLAPIITFAISFDVMTVRLLAPPQCWER